MWKGLGWSKSIWKMISLNSSPLVLKPGLGRNQIKCLPAILKAAFPRVQYQDTSGMFRTVTELRNSGRFQKFSFGVSLRGHDMLMRIFFSVYSYVKILNRAIHSYGFKFIVRNACIQIIHDRIYIYTYKYQNLIVSNEKSFYKFCYPLNIQKFSRWMYWWKFSLQFRHKIFNS